LFNNDETVKIVAEATRVLQDPASFPEQKVLAEVPLLRMAIDRIEAEAKRGAVLHCIYELEVLTNALIVFTRLVAKDQLNREHGGTGGGARCRP
jgi:hypothetical protein